MAHAAHFADALPHLDTGIQAFQHAADQVTGALGVAQMAADVVKGGEGGEGDLGSLWSIAQQLSRKEGHTE
jgi:hypothetical protein